MEIRSASVDDIPAITEIYNEIILNTDAIYRELPVLVSERTAWFNAKVSGGYPVIVAVLQDEVVGYGVFGEFRFGEGYQNTVEHSVHVRSDKRSIGIGKSLLATLIELARKQGRSVMIAAIDSSNYGSIELHKNLGFEITAQMPDVAKKNGKNLTLLLLQKNLKDA